MEVNEEPLDEWRDIMLSPKGLFMGSISDPNHFTKSVPDISSCVESTVWADDFHIVDDPVLNSEIKMENDEDVDSYKINPSGRNGISIAERRNVKFDLNAWEINNNNNNYYNDTSSKQRFRSCSPLASPAPDQSPCLTMPSGISPTALLDSPVMLSNSQLSPTTGTLASPNRDTPVFSSESLSFDKDEDDDDRSSLGFKPPAANAIPFSYYSTLQSQAAPYPNHLAHCSADNQNHDAAERSMDLKSPPNSNMQLDNTAMPDNNALFQPTRLYGLPAEESRKDNVAVDPVAACPPQQNHRGPYPSVVPSKTSEDGYNWRKYGQKQVKGSEFPRSYYKCTYANCLVKKKVERSHDGEITEIIYKGAHNHPRPQPSRRSGPSAISCVEWNENGEGEGKGKADGCSSVWGDVQNGYDKDTRLGADGLEMTSCTSVVTEISDPYSNNQGKAVGMLDSAETPELSSTLASHDDEVEDDAAEGSLSVGDDEDVESEAKRRKKEVPVIESVLGSRAVREPRVVIQIESEIDILDDGYRWRKYGQKVVKGNPNPRSYYKCTSAGCGVRKHVERASHDLKCVITTYEGKHNHEVPVARNSSHATSGTVNLSPPPTNSQASSLALPRNAHPKSEPQDFIPPFEQKMKYNGDILGSNYLGSFRSSPFCALKFPALPNSMMYGPFGINPNNHCETSGPPLLPSVGNLPISLPLTFPFTSNLGIGNYRSPSRPMNLVPPPFFPGPQMKEGGDMKLLKPKQEHSIESYCDSNSLTYSSPKNSNGYSFLNHTV